MHLLFDILLIFLHISISFSVNSVTFVFSPVPDSTVQTLLRSDTPLSNTSYVTRLSSTDANLLNSTDILRAASNTINSIAFSGETGDCSLSTALAVRYSTINVSSAICFTSVSSSLTNFLQLTITSQGLASAATLFMNHYSLTYFSIIIGSSNDFYFNLAQEFSTYLSENYFSMEHFFYKSNFTQSLLLSYRSKG